MGEKYEVVSDKIITGLSQFKGFYSQDYYLEFEDRISTMKDTIEESQKEGRLLKIGIVGEVKAGKSSFLNALIFDGEDILPKASTPMTAALTKITYAEKQSAKIVFYSVNDWRRIESFSEEYNSQFEDLYNAYVEKHEQSQIKSQQMAGENSGCVVYMPPKSREEMKRSLDKKIPDRLIACKELTDLAQSSSIDIHEYLGSEPLVLDVDDMKNGLHDYIGANGRFTSIVKHVELQMNNELLKDIEIVDTPGMNDPIISRGETTKKFLRNCDVVFLLSYCGQFMTQEDINFMCQTLPNEGIKNVVIIGSKFDSGVLDDNKSKSYKDAVNKSADLYRKEAEQNVKKCLVGGSNAEILRSINESLPPNFVSSVLFSCAVKKKKGEEYSALEENIIQQLKNHFSDFEDEVKILLSLSGIIQVKKNKLEPIKNRKQEIIKETNRKILSTNKDVLLRLLEDINIQALQNKTNLESYDKDQLEKKLLALQTKLNTMRREVKNIFENSAVEAAKFLNEMKVSIDKEIDNYVDFDVETKVTQHEGTYNDGFLGLRKNHYTYEETTYHASVADVIQNMRGYLVRCKQLTNEEFDKIINLRILREKVKATVIGAFDLGDKAFNENDILIPLEIVIKKIKIPEINIEVEEFEPMIVDAFSGATVSNDAIHELRLQENRVLEKISIRVKGEIDNCKNKVDSVMSQQAATFVDNIIKLLTDNIENIRSQIDDKENSIRQYDTLIKLLAEYKEFITSMEM